MQTRSRLNYLSILISIVAIAAIAMGLLVHLLFTSSTNAGYTRIFSDSVYVANRMLGVGIGMLALAVCIDYLSPVPHSDSVTKTQTPLTELTGSPVDFQTTEQPSELERLRLRLEELSKMKEEGVITEKEYKKLRGMTIAKSKKD